MKKKFLTTIIVFTVVTACAQTQTDKSKFNFGFEENENGQAIGWENFGSSNYVISLDSTIIRSGKYAALIEHPEGKTSDFKAWAFTLPNNYEGSRITLSGYIKTENVTDGYAGLWMRIDPDVAFNNMYDRGVTGTTGWTKYEVTLKMDPAKTKQIVIGGLLVGKGKMWLDDFSVTIDGIDISEAKIFERELSPAEKDKEFDNGSHVVFPELNNQTIANLELLGRIWGFLKYHHPEIAKGNYNWDYELFRILPDYLKVQNSKERDQILLTWIKKYGKVPSCKTCKETSTDAFLKPELSWIEKSDMQKTLKNALNKIYKNRNQGEHYYIGLYPYVWNPEFKNENSYPNMKYPDEGFRLLSLYRYWNMIQYFFPYRHLTEKDWNDILKEYIPKFISAKDELEYELTAIQIIGEVYDTHANLWNGGNKITESRGNYFAPFRVQFIENKLVITDFFNPELINKDEIKIGDIITHINGKTVESIVDSISIYYPASNKPTRLRDIAVDMLRSNKDTILIDYISSGKKKQKEIILYGRDQLNMYYWYRVNEYDECYNFVTPDIGYVTLASIKDNDVYEIMKEFEDTKGIIIDIRNYPSTFVVFTLAPYFVSTSTPFVKFTNGNLRNPGEFTFTPSLSIPQGNSFYKGKLVIMVNEITQSQAEYTSMAFRAGNNTTIIGSTTAGADGNVSVIYLPGGLRTMISGIGIYYPDGTETQRIGIVPDVWIEPTIKGITEGRDELLEKAIEIINNQ